MGHHPILWWGCPSWDCTIHPQHKPTFFVLLLHQGACSHILLASSSWMLLHSLWVLSVWIIPCLPHSDLFLHNNCSWCDQGFFRVFVYPIFSPSLGEIHGTRLVTEEYTPKNCCSRTAQNIIKILILFWSSLTLLAICDTFYQFYPHHNQFFLQYVQIYLTIFITPHSIVNTKEIAADNLFISSLRTGYQRIFLPCGCTRCHAREKIPTIRK